MIVSTLSGCGNSSSGAEATSRLPKQGMKREMKQERREAADAADSVLKDGDMAGKSL